MTFERLIAIPGSIYHLLSYYLRYVGYMLTLSLSILPNCNKVSGLQTAIKGLIYHGGVKGCNDPKGTCQLRVFSVALPDETLPWRWITELTPEYQGNNNHRVLLSSDLFPFPRKENS